MNHKYDFELERTAAVLEYHNLVDQTSTFRLSPRWESVRQLLATRGYKAAEVALCTCDHAGGNHMQITIALPDGKTVICEMRHFPPSEDYTEVTKWEILPLAREDIATAAATNPVLIEALNQAINAYRGFFTEFYGSLGARPLD